MAEGKEKKGFFKRLVSGLTKTRDNIVSGFDSIFSGFSHIDDDFYEELEEILVMGDIGIRATEEIIENLKQKVKENHIKEPADCRELLINSIKEQMYVGDTAYRFEEEKSVVLVIGVNGVGKTTTIAKIASHFCVDGGKKVALLTADTYRIAAAEQLRTYANILEVPFRIIYSVEELSQAMRDFKDCDYILVDTAGHSHQNAEQKKVMKELIHSVDGILEKEVFLVLSATTKYRDLLSIADTYSDMTDYKLIFTKLDETITLGNLLNLKLYTGAPLSYVTCGQNVPDDIEAFNPQKTVKRLLGGKQK